MRFKSNRHRLGWGLFCLGLSGTVLGLTLFKQRSWTIDGIEAVVVLLPIGIHLVLKATELAETSLEMTRLSRALREAFFVDARDVGDLGVCLEVAQELGLALAELKRHLSSGTAMAALLADYRKAGERGIKGSPSWVMNEGRQVLYGNVGYRILNANIEELLRHPEQEASWC